MGFWKDEEESDKIPRPIPNPAGWWSAEQAEFTQSRTVMQYWEMHGIGFKALYYGRDLHKLET